MDEDVAAAPAAAHNGGQLPAGQSVDWVFYGLLLGAIVLALYALFSHGREYANYVADHLPLLLPLIVVVLSMFTRLGHMKTYESLLTISNDIAIGVISFDIWVLSARSDTTGRILVNAKTMISGSLSLTFLISGVVLAVGCVVLNQQHFSNRRLKERWLLVGLVVSILVYVAPFAVLEPVPVPKPAEQPKLEVALYTVVVPYQDPGITALGPKYLGQRLLAYIAQGVEATDAAEARRLALQRFAASPESELVPTKAAPKGGGKVAVYQDQVVVARR
jgi:hypothetical protein